MLSEPRPVRRRTDNIDAGSPQHCAVSWITRSAVRLEKCGPRRRIAEPWFRHGQVLQSLKLPDQALQSYDRARSLDPVWASREPPWLILQGSDAPKSASRSGKQWHAAAMRN